MNDVFKSVDLNRARLGQKTCEHDISVNLNALHTLLTATTDDEQSRPLIPQAPTVLTAPLDPERTEEHTPLQGAVRCGLFVRV